MTARPYTAIVALAKANRRPRKALAVHAAKNRWAVERVHGSGIMPIGPHEFTLRDCGVRAPDATRETGLCNGAGPTMTFSWNTEPTTMVNPLGPVPKKHAPGAREGLSMTS